MILATMAGMDLLLWLRLEGQCCDIAAVFACASRWLASESSDVRTSTAWIFLMVGSDLVLVRSGISVVGVTVSLLRCATRQKITPLAPFFIS